MRRPILAVLVLALMTAACNGNGNGTDLAEPTPDATPETEDCVDLTGTEGAEIAMAGFAFEPSCAIVSTDQGLNLPNQDEVPHTFTLEGTEVDQEVAPGEQDRTEAIGGIVEPGTYSLFCRFHRDGGMVGELRVESA